MLKQFYKLRASTRAYLVALVLLLTKLIDGGGLIFPILQIGGYIFIVIGLYNSFLDAKSIKPELKTLEEKKWYRLVKILGYILLILGIGTFLGQGESSEKYFGIYLVLFIFGARLVKYCFYYVALEKTTTTE